MSSNFGNARDLVGVPDDADSQQQGDRLAPFAFGASAPAAGQASAARSRGSSPSPIRATHSESPSRRVVGPKAAAASPPQNPSRLLSSVPSAEKPITQQPFHLLHQAPPTVGPPPATTRTPAAAPPPSQFPPPQPQREEAAPPTAAALTVEVPNLRRETSTAAATIPATTTATATATPSQSPHVWPKKLIFSEGAEVPGAGPLPTREETLSSIPGSRRNLAASATARAADAAGRRTDGTASVLPDGKLQVRVTRDGKTTVEEMESTELAHLYAQQQAALQQMRGQFDFLTVPDWVRLHPMLGPYLAEATGTFAWVLTLSLTSIRNRSIFNKTDDTNVTCLPIGFMLTSMVFTFGYISGGHFNPAISLAVFLIRKMDLMRCMGYIICQLAAAFGAGVVAMLIQGSSDIFVPSVENSFISSGIFAELIYTFAVALVVLNIGYSRQSGNFFYGFAIGMTMAAGSASVGHISGGAFNPAAATGLQLAVCMTGNCEDLKSFWIYWLAPFVGAVVASLIYSQMYQPVHTQVLEDHKVLRDPTKAFMKDSGEAARTSGSNSERDHSDDEDGRGHGESQTNSGSDVDANGDRRNSRGHEDAVEMREIGRSASGGGGRLNDSLTERIVVRGTGQKDRDTASFV